MTREKKYVYGEILGPAPKNGQNPSSAVGLPPNVSDLTLTKLLFGHLQYHGARRTVDAYNRLVESGVKLTRTVSELHQARRELEIEKIKWDHIDDFRRVAQSEIEEELNTAETKATNSRIELAKARDTEAALGEIQEIARNDRETKLFLSELNKIKAQKELKAAKEHTTEEEATPAQKRLKAIARVREEYEAIQSEKQRVIKEYGSEEAVPVFLRTMFEQLEEELQFSFTGE